MGFIPVLLLLSCCAGVYAGDFSAAGIPGPADISVPPAAAAQVVKSLAPEYAFENMLAGPLWRAPAGAPAASDLRASFLPPRFQGKRNMCNAFAATSLAEFLVFARDGRKVPMSEEFLFYNTKYNYTARPELQAYRTTDGLSGYAAVLGLAGGMAKAEDWPFVPEYSNPAPRPPVTDPEVGAPPQGIEGRLLDYKFSPQAVRREEIKKFLAAERRPVVMNLMLYFAGVQAAGPEGRLVQPSPEERRRCAEKSDNCGGHVVLLVGYDPAKAEYIFRNSWGERWGDRGYGRVPEKYVMEDCEACGYLPKLAAIGGNGRAMMVNSAYGWSATLK
jgi:hypothetical protein